MKSFLLSSILKITKVVFFFFCITVVSILPEQVS
jgi:hypothetical protein